MKNKMLTIYGVWLVALIIFLIFLSADNLLDNKPKPKKISMIVSSNNYDSLGLIREGAEQAAEDFYVELNLLIVSNQTSADDQISLIEKELSSGAEAIVVSPSSNLIKDTIDNVNGPVVCINSNVDSNNVFSYVGPDKYKIGQDLGNKISAENQYIEKIIFIGDNENDIGQKNIMEGTKSILNSPEIELVYIPLAKINNFFDEQIIASNNSVIVALDDYSLEQTASILSSIELEDISYSVYGIGYSVKNILYLEQGILNGMIVDNQFSIGYQGVSAAISGIQKESFPPEIIVPHFFINSDNMYAEENQILLFPVR